MLLNYCNQYADFLTLKNLKNNILEIVAILSVITFKTFSEHFIYSGSTINVVKHVRVLKLNVRKKVTCANSLF